MASLLYAIYHKSLLRNVGILLWIYSSGKGLQIAWQHVNMQLDTGIFHSCILLMNFPPWLPLDKWLPFFFMPYSGCNEKQSQLMSLDIAQWVLVIFAIYLLIGILILISEFATLKKHHWFRED